MWSRLLVGEFLQVFSPPPRWCPALTLVAAAFLFTPLSTSSYDMTLPNSELFPTTADALWDIAGCSLFLCTFSTVVFDGLWWLLQLALFIFPSGLPRVSCGCCCLPQPLCRPTFMSVSKLCGQDMSTEQSKQAGCDKKMMNETTWDVTIVLQTNSLH